MTTITALGWPRRYPAFRLVTAEKRCNVMDEEATGKHSERRPEVSYSAPHALRDYHHYYHEGRHVPARESRVRWVGRGL